MEGDLYTLLVFKRTLRITQSTDILWDSFVMWIIVLFVVFVVEDYFATSTREIETPKKVRTTSSQTIAYRSVVVVPELWLKR